MVAAKHGVTMRTETQTMGTMRRVAVALALAVAASLIPATATAKPPPVLTVDVLDQGEGWFDFSATVPRGRILNCPRAYADTDLEDFAQSTNVFWLGGSQWEAEFDTVGEILPRDAECRIRYQSGRRIKNVFRTAQRGGTQTSNRGWTPLRLGGNCNYSSLSGNLLVSCLWAKSVVTYSFRVPKGKIVKAGSRGMTAGLFPCRTRVSKSIKGKRATVTMTTSNPGGFAQCELKGAFAKVKTKKKVQVFRTVTKSADIFG
jgi:hypothetical protein